MGKVKKCFFYGFTISLLLICLEISSYVAVVFLEEKNVFYTPEIYPEYQDYLATRDKVLGWPSSGLLLNNDEYDSSGSRIIPAFPNPIESQNCISLYGDSFTWSAEVHDEYAWSNVLSTLIGCRVANFGIGGYGTDQAFLRFRNNIYDDSEIVFLNHLSENILRNVNQFHDLLYDSEGIGFKPRFIIDQKGSLILVPLPTYNTNQYEDVVLRPAEFLTDEYFLPNRLSGITVISFPYTFSVVRALNHFHVKSKFRDEPWYLEFYEKDHPSKGLEVTTKILKLFHTEAIERGKVPVITIIPTGEDLLYFLKHDVWPYQNLIDQLSFSGISVLNFGEGILMRLYDKDPCLLFNVCSGHYNEEGYGMLAGIAHEFLQERELVGVVN